MKGRVTTSLELRMPITLRSTTGEEREIEFVIDTGFDGELGLPEGIIEWLDAPFSHTSRARLADGSIVRVDAFEVDVLWDGEWTTAVAEALADPLVGARQLHRLRLTAEVIPGGALRLDPLS